ncbi:MAG: DNA polymerase III subunit delta [Verrucomicrobiae bacterium]|nr:DNA polymerase III subunit delta [Verrucomicrobiae bacterium]
MPAQPTVFLIAGDEEFAVKEAAAKKAGALAARVGGAFGLEIIEGVAESADEALQVIRRLRAAIQEQGLFSRQKVVWWKNTNLLGAEVPGGEETLRELAWLNELLRDGLPEGVTLLVSAIGFDRRRALARTLEKIADTQFFAAPNLSREEGERQIAAFIRQRLAAANKRFADEDALAAFRELVEPTFREIANELDKLCIYVGKRTDITAQDVRMICSASRQAVIWGLVDAIGQRNLLKATAALNHLLDQGESAIGAVAMLATQFRLMILASDLMERGVLQRGGNRWEYKDAFEQLPADATWHFPRGKDGGLPNSWRFGRAAAAANRFRREELIAGLDRLLEAHLQLVTTQLDERLILQQTVTRIVHK